MLGRPRSRSTVIVVLLVATLAIAAALAYEAQQAARSHRVTAENVLRDYSRFAAWELARVGRTQLLNVIHQELQEIRSAIERGGLAAGLTPSSGCSAGCGGGAHRVRTVFYARLADGQFSYAGKPAPPAVIDLLSQVAAGARRAPKDFTCPALRVIAGGLSSDAANVVVWRPDFDGADTPVGIIGFVAEPSFIAHVFENLVTNSPLLPPSLVPSGDNPNAALTVRVGTPEGHALFVAGGPASPYEGREQFKSDLGALTLSVALRPDAAGTLIIGGLPRERLPLVAGLLALTAGLVVVALIQLRREAELSRLRSDFVSGVSHELRTPLAQIRMFTETLLLGRVRSETEGRRSLEIIARETQRLAQLVENVLLFARGERRRPQISRATVRMAPLVADVVETFAPLAAARESRVVTEIDPGATADVDAGAIRQILLNLLDNAVKHGPAGQTITVALHVVSGHLHLAVEDGGPGVAPRDAERIWEPFNRLARSNTATGGAGIGLAIVRQLVDLHGGRAWVEPGRAGARFVVSIPSAWVETGAAAVA